MKITYNPDQFEAVANLVWQNNPYLKNHPYIKSIDDVRSHMHHTTKVLIGDNMKVGSIFSMGYCILIARFDKNINECEIEYTFDPSVGVEDRPFITINASELGL